MKANIPLLLLLILTACTDKGIQNTPEQPAVRSPNWLRLEVEATWGGRFNYLQRFCDTTNGNLIYFARGPEGTALVVLPNSCSKVGAE